MRIPIFKRLKKQSHKNIALLQDQVLDIVYSLQNNAVLHGGTAIWRCFSGARFSEDLDFYFVPKPNFKKTFAEKIESAGLTLVKFKKTNNSIFSKISYENTVVSLEVLLKNFSNPIVREYEKTDAGFFDIFTLSPEQLFFEKLNAYKNRKLIRDIYDVYFLAKFIKPDNDFNKKTCLLLESLPAPVDENNLKTLILFGAVPSYLQMIDSLKRRFY